MRESNGDTICICVAISSHDIIRIFPDNIVDCGCYLVMLQKNFMLQLVTEIFVLSQWFMQDGAKLPTARVVLDFLHETSGDMLISRDFPWHHKCGHVWPPHSPYILII